MSLGLGAISAVVAWIAFFAAMTVLARFGALGWYIFWGSLCVCTVTSMVSAITAAKVLKSN
jgi:hypothetical protein